MAHIFVGVQVNGDADRHDLVAELKTKGYELSDLTDNEMAKLHIRHMVGGRAVKVVEEQVFRFEFPERPGALLNFLAQLGGGLIFLCSIIAIMARLLVVYSLACKLINKTDQS